MDRARVVEFAKEQGYDGAEPLGQWRGHDIYEPTFEQSSGEEPAIVGPPLIIMVKDDVIRMSTEEEAFQQIGELPEEENSNTEE